MNAGIKLSALALSVFALLSCGSAGGGDTSSSSSGSGSATFRVNVSGAAANKLIALSVINESTRRMVSGFNFDFTSGGDATNGSGDYSKVITGLTSGTTYTIVVRSDVNGNMVQDTNDTGQLVTGVSPGSTQALSSLQVLSTLSPTAPTDATVASKTAGCVLGTQNFQTSDLTAGTAAGYAGAVAVTYNASGVGTITAGYFVPNTYQNVMCAIDMNGNNITDSGDKYQFVAGPITLPAGNDATTFAIGAWSTY